MAENSPKAGTYILTGLRWRRQNKDGSSTLYKQGDEVELSAGEASRLVGGKISSFKSKPSSAPAPAEEVDDEGDNSLVSLGSPGSSVLTGKK